MADGIRITGLRETIRSLERLGVSVEDLRDAFGAISNQVITEATGIVPVNTGALRSTIRAAKTKNKAVVRAGNASVKYAGLINYGWPAHNITGTEYLTGPANNNTADYLHQIEHNLAALIRKYGLN